MLRLNYLVLPKGRDQDALKDLSTFILNGSVSLVFWTSMKFTVVDDMQVLRLSVKATAVTGLIYDI